MAARVLEAPAPLPAAEPATHTAPRYRLRANRLGLWLFIASEAFLFAAVISARFVLLGNSRPQNINQTAGLVISFVLLLSSLTAYRAETAIAHGDRVRFVRNMIGTLMLGAIFMGGVVLEWWEGLEFFPPSTRFGSVFFTLIGMHAFHVFTGMGALSLVLAGGLRGKYGPGDYWPVEGVIKYWHFVDVAWVFIFPTLYLVS